MKMTKVALLVVSLMAGMNVAYAASDAEIENSFNPYKSKVPTAPGVTAGVAINKANVGQFKGVLDQEIGKMIGQGDMEIVVEDTHPIPLHPNYIAATREHSGKVKLGSNSGTLEGYVAGRPFPEKPDGGDPRAGEKLAFNFKYAQIVGDSGRIYPFIWTYRDAKSGKVERKIDFDFHFINFKHRVTQDPMPNIEPNPSDIYRGIYLKVLAPNDLKNTQLLIHRYDDDTKLDDSYLYLGFQRRVRRLATGQTTDSFLGSDLMIEDFEGYNGRVLDMEWKYVETRNALLPVYRHSEWKGNEEKDSDGYGQITFGGKSNCFMNVPWSLRTVHVLEGTPTNKASPIGKRVIYMDAETSVLPMLLIYDRKGELWKVWTVSFSDSAFHAPANKNAGIAIYTGASMFDVQAQHCTTLQLRMITDSALNPPSLFAVQNLRGGD